MKAASISDYGRHCGCVRLVTAGLIVSWEKPKKTTRFTLLLLLAGLGFSASLMASVYTNGVAMDIYGPSPMTISAWTQPNLGGDGAILDLAIDPGNILRPTAYSIGIGHAWYGVSSGTVVDATFASTATPFANALTADLSGHITMSVGSMFLLGFWLDEYENNIPGPGDRFGWAALKYTGSSLVLVDSAIDDSATGIIAGTTTVVPEPATYSLILSACGFAFLLRKHHKRR